MTNEEMARELETALNHVSPVIVPGARGRIARVIESLRRPQPEPLAEGFTTEDAAQCLRKYGQFTIWSKPIDKVRVPVTITRKPREEKA